MEKDLAITMDSEISELDSALNEGSQDAFEPIPIKVEIVHATGELKIEGLPSMKSFKGVILSAMKSRVFFSKFGNKEVNKDVNTFTEGRPFCSSVNGVMGKLYESPDWNNINNPSKDAILMMKEKIGQGGLVCKKCPLSAFGSVTLFGNQGRGQACNDLRRLLLWRPNLAIPMILTLPPTSIRKFDAYISSLQAGGFQFNKVITTITLKEADSTANKYSVAEFQYDGDITSELIQELVQPIVHDGVQKILAKALIDIFSKREVEVNDYINTEDSDSF